MERGRKSCFLGWATKCYKVPFVSELHGGNLPGSFGAAQARPLPLLSSLTGPRGSVRSRDNEAVCNENLRRRPLASFITGSDRIWSGIISPLFLQTCWIGSDQCFFYSVGLLF